MEVQKLWFASNRLYIETTAGETFSQPLRFYPNLQQAIAAQYTKWEQSYFGLHWSEIDEDISFESFTWADSDPLRLYHKDIH
jgi:hypothetical protein